MPSDFMRDLINDAMVKAGMAEAEPSESVDGAVATDLGLSYGLPIIGTGANTLNHFAQGITGGHGYREHLDEIENREKQLAGTTGGSDFASVANLSAVPLQIAHGAGRAGATINDLAGLAFDYITD